MVTEWCASQYRGVVKLETPKVTGDRGARAMTSSPFETFNAARTLEAFGASLRWIWHRATVAPSSGQRAGEDSD